MSGHHGIGLRGIGRAQDMPPRTARTAIFAPARALPAHFADAHTVAAAFAAAAFYSGSYKRRRGLTAVFAPAAAL